MMIGDVTSLVPGASAPVPLQAGSIPATVADQADASKPGTANFDYTVSQIRVDVDADIAILEFKSVQTGDVIRQYPTEKQIAGYQRAAQLVESKNQREATFGAAAASSNPNAVLRPGVQSSNASQINSSDASGASQSVQGAPQSSSPVGSSSGTSSNVNVNAGTAQLSDTSSVSVSA